MVFCQSKTIKNKQCKRKVSHPNTVCHNHKESCAICYFDFQPHELSTYGCCAMRFCIECKFKKIEFNYRCPGCRSPIHLTYSEFWVRICVFVNYIQYCYDETGYIPGNVIIDMFEYIYSHDDYIEYIKMIDNESVIIKTLRIYATLIAMYYDDANGIRYMS